MVPPFLPVPALQAPTSTEFHGSMVVEVPLKGLEAQKDGDFLELDQFGGATCDDTSIALLRIARKVKRGSDKMKLPMEFFIYVRPSFDRVVYLYLTLMDGERPVATTSISTIKAAEKRGTWARGAFEIKSSEWSALYADGHAPTLKILMKVVPNE